MRAGAGERRLSYREALEELADLRPALLQAAARRVAGLVSRLLERFGSHPVPYRPPSSPLASALDRR